MSQFRAFLTGGIFSGVLCYALVIVYVLPISDQGKELVKIESKSPLKMDSVSPIQDPIYCKETEYCLGELCDFQCSGIEIGSTIRHPGGFRNTRNVVDITNSNCSFLYSASCNFCSCVNRTSRFKDEANKHICEPCQFKSLGWLRMEERKKCAPETCPILFPS